MLGGYVTRRARPRQLALDRRRDDYPAGLARKHVVQRAPDAPEDVVQVEVEHALPVLVGNRGDWFVSIWPTRVQDDDVDATALLRGLVEQRFDRRLVADVA